ncbi:Hypothetical protein FKW44_017737, partial [Caligus rogercresseyi]
LLVRQESGIVRGAFKLSNMAMDMIGRMLIIKYEESTRPVDPVIHLKPFEHVRFQLPMRSKE